MKKEKFRFENLSIQVLAVAIVGIISVSMIMSITMVNISKQAFSQTYGLSQEKVFRQIEFDLNEYHENLIQITNAIDASWAFRLYLKSTEPLEGRLDYKTGYQMQMDLKKSVSSEMDDTAILVTNLDGKTYLNKNELIITSKQEILQSPVVKDALASPGTIVYRFAEQGFSSAYRNQPVLLAARALTDVKSRKIYGVVLFTIKESDIKKLYNYMISDTTDFYLLDEENKIVSSNQKSQVGTAFTKQNLLSSEIENQTSVRRNVLDGREQKIILEKNLPYFKMRAVALILPNRAIGSIYNVPKILGICAVITLCVMCCIVFMIQRLTKPLSELIWKMSKIKESDFQDYMEVKGSSEMKELAATYNYMLDDINHYIDELMATQKEKRKAEMTALQMQINPHYIYNTLASIKWMVWQKEGEKAIQMIDAFISLLRNTISNKDEFITIEKEMDNLKNYVLIQNTRYGDRIQVEFFVADDCRGCLLPKMILQPFIENAFFHGFPDEQKGNIYVFVNQRDNRIKIDIVDNGVGMDHERLDRIPKSKSEHYSGIGINNISERIKLIYGEEYGVHISSKMNQGTTVTVFIPICQEKEKK